MFRSRRSRQAAHATRPGHAPAAPAAVYDRAFWFTYVSNSLLMVAVSLLFRYADFVTLLGGSEVHLGWIVGIGMVGSLVMRLALGSCIDRYGSRRLWLCSTSLFVASCFGNLAVTSHTGPAIYLLRMAFCCAVAGVYGASMTFLTARSPSARMAEVVAMLGTAGFLGTVVGTLLGDILFGGVQVDRRQVSMMFIAAGAMGFLSLPFAWAATRSEVRPTHAAHLPTLQVLRQYYSGAALVVGVAMGIGLGLPNTFLRTYAAELAIPRIGLFFTVYAAAAIITRLLTRSWFERFGTRPIILLGVSGLALSQCLFLLVGAEWQLFLPAIGYGSSHAVVFPAIVAAGSMAFPARHRGLATLLILAAWDVGQLIGAPLAGMVLHYSARVGLPPYPTMFLIMAGLLGLVVAWYAAATPCTTGEIAEAPEA